jgi:hypothetical protein
MVRSRSSRPLRADAAKRRAREHAASYATDLRLCLSRLRGNAARLTRGRGVHPWLPVPTPVLLPHGDRAWVGRGVHLRLCRVVLWWSMMVDLAKLLRLPSVSKPPTWNFGEPSPRRRGLIAQGFGHIPTRTSAPTFMGLLGRMDCMAKVSGRISRREEGLEVCLRA